MVIAVLKARFRAYAAEAIDVGDRGSDFGDLDLDRLSDADGSDTVVAEDDALYGTEASQLDCMACVDCIELLDDDFDNGCRILSGGDT